MTSPKIKLPVLVCQKCGHEWTPRKPKPSVRCPKCQTWKWALRDAKGA